MYCVTKTPGEGSVTVDGHPATACAPPASREPTRGGSAPGTRPPPRRPVRRHREVPLAPRQDEPDDEAPQPQRDTARKHLSLADGGRGANHPTAAVNLAALVEICATNRGTEGGTTTDRLCGSTPSPVPPSRKPLNHGFGSPGRNRTYVACPDSKIEGIRPRTSRVSGSCSDHRPAVHGRPAQCSRWLAEALATGRESHRPDDGAVEDGSERRPDAAASGSAGSSIYSFARRGVREECEGVGTSPTS